MSPPTSSVASVSERALPPLDQLLMAESGATPHLAAGARILLRTCLLELPRADQVLVELRVCHGWSAAEIALMRGSTELEVSRTLNRVLERIAHRMGEHAPVELEAQTEVVA